MSGKVRNYPPTPCGNTKLQKPEYPLRCSIKNLELAPNSTFFLGAEFLLFGNAKLERSCKTGSGAAPNTPLVPYW